MNRRSFLQLAGYSSGAALTSCMSLPNSTTAQLTQSRPAHFHLQLDWLLTVQFAGVLLADYLGLYEQQGLVVNIHPWQQNAIVPNLVAETPLMIGCAEQNLILDAQAKGMPLKAIATMFQASPYALMSLPARGITSLEDLVGQRIGVHIDGINVLELVKGVSELSEIEVVEIPHENKLDRLLSGEFAAVQCYALDEPIAFLRQIGEFPLVLSMDQYGYTAYAQVLFTTDALLEQHSEQVRAFLIATFEGWTIALNNILNAAQIVVKEYVEPNSPYFDLEYQIQSLELVRDYVLRGITESQIGQISPERWQEAAIRMADYQIIDTLPNLNDSLDLSVWSSWF
jgi:NitT/TauT family transport system substrate-binding protein